MAFGRLNTRTQPKPMSDINMTPLVDVMLVLVAILLVTAPMLASSIRLNLPRTDLPGSPPVSAASPTPPLAVVIDAAGTVFVNDVALTADELEPRLLQAAAQSPDTEVQLRADANVPYGRVVELMGAAHRAGLSRVGFVAEPAQAAASTPGATR